MGTFLIAAASAFWLGILTSISPCPLASNIAAISFIGRKVGNSRQVVLSGLAYTIGRMAAYLVVGAIIVAGLLTIPGVSSWLQRYMNRLLGPVLILVGMFLLELIRFNLPSTGAGARMQALAEKGGVAGAGVLGIVFALSFCPVSAALFFGSLITLAAANDSIVVLPSLYGIGTGLPVVIFAVLIAVSAQSVGKAFNRLRQFEWWARQVTGAVFVLVGMYYTLRYIFGVI